MAKKWRIPGLSFSWKRASGLTSLRQKIAKATGIPTTAGGWRRKFGPFGLFWLFGGMGTQMAHFFVHCPQCGLKSNINASSVGTMRKCQNCGNKFIITQPPPAPAGSSLGGCVIGLFALLGVGAVVVLGCCGFGMIGSAGRVAPPPATPAAPVSTSPASAGSQTSDRVPVAETTPMPTEAPPAEPMPTEPMPTEPKPEIPAAAPAFDATTIAFAPAETAERTRAFKSTDGKFSVEAVLLAMRNEVVHLRRVDNGNVIEVPMDKLANSDRIWIRKIASTDRIKGR